ncbi:MAG: DinB family protein [Actinomycetota bacterium]
MAITPDTKDWTFVLERTCPECGFDVRAVPRDEIGSLIRANAARWRPLLEYPDVPRRPSDDRWSALEYACHVRDVFQLYDDRLLMMLEEDDPHYPNWDQDAAAIEERYGQQDPAEVAQAIEDNADRLAAHFDEVEGDDWGRPGTRSDGARFSIESFARYLIHDPFHHLHDVERGYAALSGS